MAGTIATLDVLDEDFISLPCNNRLLSMAKKKKKSASSQNESISSSKATPVVEQCSVSLLDCLSLRLTTSKGSDTVPKAVLAVQDAARLDIQSHEKAILIALEQGKVKGVTIATVSTAEAFSSPPRVGSRNAVTEGKVQISPQSLVDILLGTREEVSNMLETPVKSVAVATPATPASANSHFSFKIGGGGDQLYSTPKSPSPVKVASRSLNANIVVVPLESRFGQLLGRTMCKSAKCVFVSAADEANAEVNEKSSAVINRLILAHWNEFFIQEKECRIISFQGKKLRLTIDAIEAEPEVSMLEDRLGSMSLDEHDGPLSSDAEMIVKALEVNPVSLFKVTYSTSIVVTMGSKSANTKVEKTTPQKLVAGLDVTVDHVRTLVLSCLAKTTVLEQNVSLQAPRGLLLFGASGKTSLAKQIASELEDICDSQYVNCVTLQSQTTIVGAAERQLEKLFKAGKRPKLLILDDIHLICPKRTGFNASVDRLASTLLALLDGIDSDKNPSSRVVLLAITSNPSVLDSALRRAGRLDNEVEVPLPDEPSTRAKILKFHAEKMNMNSSISDSDWEELAKLAKGFDGADCMLAVKEGTRLALHSAENKIELTTELMKPAIRATKPSAIKSITVEIPQVKWTSIGGMDSVKRELREAIELPTQQQELFQKMQIPQPRGVLLYGPPGCSKTLMARALATEGHMNFLAVKGPELLSKWLGESERALASLFRRARMASPSIIFFDEIDALACKRGGGDSASSGRLLSQLLTEIDGVNHTGSAAGKRKDRVVVVGATNRPDLLDSALLRPGRIDKMIYVGVPDMESRKQILEISLKDKATSDDINIEQLAQDHISGGFSGAEIVALVRDSALFALEEDDTTHGQSFPRIQMRHLLRASQEMPRQITREMLDFYATFRDNN